jgi:hypothetical protein
LAEIQHEHQTWDEFKKAFLCEYGEKNRDALFLEMLNHTQGDASVGKYMPQQCRCIFVSWKLRPRNTCDYFIRNLKMGLRESTFVTHPENLGDAIEVARKAKDMYGSLS